MPRKVFFSFHFNNDVFRVQQVRNMGVLDGNEPVSVNDWETVKRGGDEAVKRWINNNIDKCDCVIVLIGSDTANRPLVIHEIERAWNKNKGLFGIHIHNLNCLRNGRCRKGANPFDKLNFSNGTKLSSKVKCYDTSPNNAYNEIKDNIARLVDTAIQEARQRN
jgi:hypothetical protein